MFKFFIDRPVFSIVISLVISLAGLAMYFVLPVEQFPDIVPPTVSITASYPGADSKVLAETVAIPIEEKVNGVDDMIYFASSSDNNGNLNMLVTFEIGTDPDMATVNVNNRVQQALPSLPEDVTRRGVVVQKRSTGLLMLLSVYDEFAVDNPEANRGDTYLCNYATIKLKDVLARVPGVGEARVFEGKSYGMRIWLNPELMAERGLSTSDVISIIQQQNMQVAAGRIGQSPAPETQEQEIVVTTTGRLETVEQFENLVVRTGENGEILQLKDIARVELGAQTYDQISRINGRPASTLAIFQLPGANAVQVVKDLRKTLDELKPMFDRDGIDYKICYDATNYINSSIHEVLETLIIAVILVVLVVYVFLQDWRASLIPTLSIPVSLLGTFALMAGFGFSINTLTLFGIVLVIGIVVDDTIVVVEDCQRLIDEENMEPREATIHAMKQVSGPVIATAMVLMAVFIPTALMPGIVGRLYAQFALTIAGATAISAIVALTLAPALCAILLRKSPEKKMFLFRWFNSAFDRFTGGYLKGVSRLLRVSMLVLALWVAMIFGLGKISTSLPTGFLPNDDQAALFVEVRLPDGASVVRTHDVTSRLTEEIRQIPGVENVVFVDGVSLVDDIRSSNVAVGIVDLEDWKQRKVPGLHANDILQKIQAITVQYPEANFTSFGPPPIVGLGFSGGVTMQLLDKGETGDQRLFEAMNTVIDRSMESGKFLFASSSFRSTTPMYYLDIDREKAQKLGVPMSELFGALQSYFGSYYVNDFNRFGRVFKVMIQSDTEYRASKEDLQKIKVRNRDGEMLPVGTFLKETDDIGSEVVYRFNMYPSTLVNTMTAPGVSSGQGMEELKKIVGELGQDYGYSWTDMTYQEAKVGSSTTIVFVLAIAFAFLVLAAQYESWSAPIIIMMAIPFAIFGAFLGVAMRGMEVNVYTSIGIIILIGLTAKNSILIVEFARKEGMSLFDSAMQAAKLRLRPILMTSFAFIFGVLPLAIASGAGAAGRQAIGTAVCCGMTVSTFVGIFVTPVLFFIIQGLAEWLSKQFRQALGQEKTLFVKVEQAT